MPSERFLNLPEEKQQRILQASVNEFLRVPYDQVSINRIIQAAGIPRGSFYQYFRDKRDLLEYLMHSKGADMRRLISHSLGQNGGDMFAMFGQVLEYAIAASCDPPKRALYNNVFSGACISDVDSFSFSQLRAGEVLAQLGDEADFSGFCRRDKAFLQDLLDILIILLRQTIARLFADVEPVEELRAGFLRKLDIVRLGVLMQGGDVL